MSTAQFICKRCGYAGSVKKAKKGSVLIEILLWCVMIVPGLIYSVWRRSNRPLVCPKCHSNDVIPADSPIGQQLSSKR